MDSTVSRRNFLKIGGAAAALLATGCSAVAGEINQNDLPEILAAPDTAPPDALTRFVKRAGYGPRPGDYQHARELGLEALLEEQLYPAEIEDPAANILQANLNIYHMDATQMVEQDVPDIVGELLLSTASRAIFSRRQLYEAMVEFWSDHFHIYLRKNQVTTRLKILDDRDVIRPNALGNFRDLLHASARSQAMLVYLDNVDNSAEAPNENYARELLELHTLGVDGGYTEEDVRELSRALTGWGVRRRGLRRGEFFFDAAQHDDASKQILGLTLSAGQGERDVNQALDMLADHPATANFIATKLVRRFVSDDPPESLVSSIAAEFLATAGDIKAMLRVLFLSEEFASAPPKLKRPYTYMVSALRALNVQVRLPGYRTLHQHLRALGQVPFMWPAPDGYPDVAEAWTANLLPRWNFALALTTGQIRGVQAPLEELAKRADVSDVNSTLSFFSGLIYNEQPPAKTVQLLSTYVGAGALDDQPTRQRIAHTIGLLLASPEFQWI